MITYLRIRRRARIEELVHACRGPRPLLMEHRRVRIDKSGKTSSAEFDRFLVKSFRKWIPKWAPGAPSLNPEMRHKSFILIDLGNQL